MFSYSNGVVQWCCTVNGGGRVRRKKGERDVIGRNRRSQIDCVKEKKGRKVGQKGAR